MINWNGVFDVINAYTFSNFTKKKLTALNLTFRMINEVW